MHVCVCVHFVGGLDFAHFIRLGAGGALISLQAYPGVKFGAGFGHVGWLAVPWLGLAWLGLAWLGTCMCHGLATMTVRPSNGRGRTS